MAENLGFVDGGYVKSVDEKGEGELVRKWVLPGMKKLDMDGVIEISFYGEGKNGL